MGAFQKPKRLWALEMELRALFWNSLNVLFLNVHVPYQFVVYDREGKNNWKKNVNTKIN